MKRPSFGTVAVLLADILLLALCAMHVPSLLNRARAPFAAHDSAGVIVVEEILDAAACPGLQAHDRILTWAGAPLVTADAIEFKSNALAIGEKVVLTVRRAREDAIVEVQCIPHFNSAYVIVALTVGVVTWLMAVFVFLARHRDPAAVVIHWAMIALAVSVIVAYEGNPPGAMLGFLSSILFFLAYTAVAIVFYLFTLIFPARTSWPRALSLAALPGIAVGVITLVLYSRAAEHGDIGAFVAFNTWYDVFHACIVLYVAAGVVRLVFSYRSAGEGALRRQLLWVLWGLCVGSAPFLFLNVVPQLFQPTSLVPEEAVLPFLLLIPASFAIAIVREHLLDIEVVIKRTTVYALVITVLLAVYTTLVVAVATFTGQMAASAGAAVLVALFFEPVRVRVQGIVDRRFFRVRYSFRQAMTSMVERLRTCYDENSLAKLVVDQLDMLLPCERCGVLALTEESAHLRMLAQRGCIDPRATGWRFSLNGTVAWSAVPLAQPSVLEPGVEFQPDERGILRVCGAVIGFPVLTASAKILGFIVLGAKHSGERFVAEDVDLIQTIAAQVGAALDRIRLHRALFAEQAEAQRLDELNRIKSDFVSYVSHEIRNPLTSMQTFIHLLKKSPKLRDRRLKEYVVIMEDETARLRRMVTNILDAARIDQGLAGYTMEQTDLIPIVRGVLGTMCHELTMHGFEVSTRFPAREILITGNPEAIGQAVANLLSNAIKYSAERKQLTVTVLRSKGRAICRVADRGVGISPAAIPHLFEKFYRDPAHATHTNGVGLGLPIVKYIMDAHRGSIEVQSTQGRGSTFTLSFPLRNTQKKRST